MHKVFLHLNSISFEKKKNFGKSLANRLVFPRLNFNI